MSEWTVRNLQTDDSRVRKGPIMGMKVSTLYTDNGALSGRRDLINQIAAEHNALAKVKGLIESTVATVPFGSPACMKYLVAALDELAKAEV